MLFAISFLGLLWTLFRAFKIPIRVLPLLGASSIALILYAAAILDCLEIVGQVLKYFGIGSCVFGFFFELKKRKDHIPRVPDSLFWLLGIGILNFILVQHRSLAQWDEFTFWGVVSKFIFQHHHLPEPSSILLFKDYPTGVALWAYFVYSCWGFYSEPLLYFAQNILIFSCLFVFYDPKNPLKFLVQMIAGLVIGLLFEKSLLHSAYVDILIGFYFFAVTFLICVLKRKTEKLSVLPMIFYLGLIKQVGYFFAWMLTIWMGIEGGVFLGLAACLGAVLVHQSWAMHVAGLGFAPSFRPMHFDWKQMVSITPHFGSAFLFGTFNSRLIFSPAVLSGVLGFVQFYILKITNPSNQKKMKRLFGWLLIGLICHVLGLLVLYAGSYSHHEVKQLESFSRYLSQYFVAYTLITVSLGLHFSRQRLLQRTVSLKLAKIGLCALVLFFLCLPPSKPHGVVSFYDREEIARHAQKIQVFLQGKRARIFLVDKRYIDGFSRYLYAYELPDVEFNGFGSVCLSAEVLNHSPEWFVPISLSEWTEILKSYDYVFLDHVDDAFWLDYGKFFPEHETGLFAVKKEQKKMTLERVNLFFRRGR